MPDLAVRLAGKAVDIVRPSAWMLRCDLGSVRAQSVPFLDASVRHRPERLTPWRAADVFYRIDTRPDPAAPDHVTVAVALTP